MADHIEDNDSRELTQEELDKVAGGWYDLPANAPRGSTCPTCHEPCRPRTINWEPQLGNEGRENNNRVIGQFECPKYGFEWEISNIIAKLDAVDKSPVRKAQLAYNLVAPFIFSLQPICTYTPTRTCCQRAASGEAWIPRASSTSVWPQNTMIRVSNMGLLVALLMPVRQCNPMGNGASATRPSSHGFRVREPSQSALWEASGF